MFFVLYIDFVYNRWKSVVVPTYKEVVPIGRVGSADRNRNITSESLLSHIICEYGCDIGTDREQLTFIFAKH